MTKAQIDKIVRVDKLLGKKYGPRRQIRRSDPLTELILTILSQNTNDTNRDRAFHALKDNYPDWDSLLDAPVRSIAAKIRVAGLADIRARRIKKVLQSIAKDHRALDLNFLEDWSDRQIKDYLLDLDGVGPKTAACVLAFALGRNVMPVDTHVLRVSARLGLIPPKMTADAAHEFYLGARDTLSLYQLHLNLIAHGREVCQARRPRCPDCLLKATCDFFRNKSGPNKIVSGHKTATSKALI